ncbi:MAG: hypothetical protein PHD32_07025 [Eubacteriales bacterium]|nr:hypothetical protein [Eubacteriales bacterium]
MLIACGIIAALLIVPDRTRFRGQNRAAKLCYCALCTLALAGLAMLVLLPHVPSLVEVIRNWGQ